MRQLLEEESTWVAVGRGTVEDLAVLIASCLPGRSGEGALAAGRAVAGGLLEFAVRDLEPEWFGQVLFARLDRMQTDQASDLDQAMISLHADLAAQFAHQHVVGADRFARVMGQLGRTLDRLPRGPADRGEVAVYLAGLIRWLDTDPWPQYMKVPGPALTPSLIERKLRIVSRRGQHEEVLDVGDLAGRCTRLVVLGGPGSGKTWLARQTARRCAEAALEALAAGALLDEVELPVYTTCARLFAAPPSDGIRHAIVASALGLLPDLGGERVLGALKVLFEERDAPTLLVADSLDEARGADDRIRQADTLPPAWRIVLTSRPASWHRQLTVGDDDPSRQAGVLQPLRYPGDVEPFIAGWFSGRSGWAADLTAQLRDRPSLQSAATVPLILAFYCIIGGGQPLPGHRADLYDKVIRRLLIGWWRGSGDERDPDLDACLETLRDWAWSAAAVNPVSGVGAWADEFPSPRVRQSRDDREALDRVAVPLGPPDADTGMLQRRFVHRSLREHLVAQHVALRMPAEEAAGELLNHLWYDPDWEYAAPAALAMHPQRDQVLKELICRAASLTEFPQSNSVFETCRDTDIWWECREFLARVAAESREADWSAASAQVISQARVDLAWAGCLSSIGYATSWPDSDSQVREELLGQLSRADPSDDIAALAEAVSRLDPTLQDRRRAQEALLRQLEIRPGESAEVVHLITRLDPTAEDRRQAREVLLRQLETYSGTAPYVAEAIGQLGPTAEERRQVRQVLLRLLPRQWKPEAEEVAAAIVLLDPPPEDRPQVRETLLGWLAAGIGADWEETDVMLLAARLAVTAGERLAVLGWLVRAPGSVWIWETVARLQPTAEERAIAWHGLLERLGTDTGKWTAIHLPAAVARLAVTAEERTRTREALLGLLASCGSSEVAAASARAITELGPVGEERTRVREALLGWLARQTGDSVTAVLADMLARLDPSSEEQAQARQALLGQLTGNAPSHAAMSLAKAITQLDPTAADRGRARHALLERLSRGANSVTVARMADAVAWFDPAAGDRRHVREALLEQLVRETGSWVWDDDDGWKLAADLADAVARLEPTPEELSRARRLLLERLAHERDSMEAVRLANAIARFGPRAEDRRQAPGLLT